MSTARRGTILRQRDDIPYNRTRVAAGVVETVAPGVRRLVAHNASPYTFTGTCSYIVGRGQVAIIDPGADDADHLDALAAAVRGETVTHIFVTHTHRDHSPGAARLKALTGARVFAEGPHRTARALNIGELNPLDAAADHSFRPDIALADGEVVEGGGWTIEAVTTPGHTANHMCYALREPALTFTGDHIMAWSTTIVAPPDGAMGDYIASVEKLRHRPERIFYPGHGAAVRDAPRFLAGLLRHRAGREASILRRLSHGDTDIASLVRAVYIGLDPRLVGGARLSTLAHLEDLVMRGMVATDGAPSIAGNYRLA